MRRRQLTPAVREAVAENMKERVYATITLLAVLAASWQHTTSIKSALIAIAGTVIALWLATLIAARMSYRAVHGRTIELREYRKFIFTSSGLLGPAIAPILLIMFSSTGLYDLKTALVGSIVVLLLSLFIMSFLAGLKIYDSIPRLFIVSVLEMSVGVGVIVLKLAVGE